MARRFSHVFAFVLLAGIALGWVWTPHPPGEQLFRDNALEGFSWIHPFGIDGLGRDFLSRCWLGLANTLGLSMGALAISATLAAVLLGIERSGIPFLSGAIHWLVGLWVAVPVLFISLICLVFLPPSPQTLMVAVGVGNVPLTFRQLRVLWMGLQQRLFVQASEVLGASPWLKFRFTLFPNLLPDLAGLGRLVFAIAALELSGLAFLGLIGDPDFPELGGILQQNHAYLYKAPHLILLPGILLSGLLWFVHAGRKV